MTDADKDRLAKIMAYGKDVDKWPKLNNRSFEDVEEIEEPEVDRFDECKFSQLNNNW